MGALEITQMDRNNPHPTDSGAGRRLTLLLSAFFVLLGIGAITWLIWAVTQDPAIRLALQPATADGEATPSLIMAFLTRFGIVLPVMVLALGAMSIGLGLRLRTGNIVAARWANVTLAWLAVGGGVVAVAGLVRTLFALTRAVPGQAPATQWTQFLAGTATMLVCGALFLWLNGRVDKLFSGQEQLGSRERRLAWTLLIPTLAVFLLVAARPLEQTFIRSLTDKRFAGREVPSFVGLQNYQELLGMRLDVVTCRLDDETGLCTTARDGSIRWESIDRPLLQEGYRTVWNLRLPGQGTPRSLALSGQDPDFLRSIWTTLFFTVVSVALELSLALFMAMTVNSSFGGRGLMRAVMLIPWAIPTVVSARLWELMLKDTSAGVVNRLLMDAEMVDAPQAWLSAVSLQLPAAIAVDVWKTTPFMALLLLAGLQSISRDLYEAASVDGASRIRQFVAITLPLLRPTIAVALVFRTLDALRVFDLFNVLFGRQQLSMATYNYETLVNNQQDGYASAISIILFFLISIFAVIYVRMLNVETD